MEPLQIQKLKIECSGMNNVSFCICRCHGTKSMINFSN